MWAFQKKQAAGKSTDTLPDSECLHIPLVAGDRAEGVLSVRLKTLPTLEQRELLDAFAAQLAVFVNKERALQESREAQVARESQKLQKVLFDSVSHELKTPLAAMTAALQQPRPNSAELQQAARRLTHTVDNLLDATRLESGLLQPVREWCDPGELVHEAVAASGLKEGDVQINIAKNLPAVSVDSGLIQQALNALLSNAMSYGKSDRPIEVSATRDDSIAASFPSPIAAPVSNRERKQKYSKSSIAVRALVPVVSASVCRLRDNWSRRMAARSLRRTARGAVRCFPFVCLSVKQCDFLARNLWRQPCRREKLSRRRYPPLRLQRRVCHPLNESRRASH